MWGPQPDEQAVPQAAGQTPQHPGHCQGALWLGRGDLRFERWEEEAEAFVVIYVKRPVVSAKYRQPAANLGQRWNGKCSPTVSPQTVLPIPNNCCKVSTSLTTDLSQIWKNSDLFLSDPATIAWGGAILGQQRRFMRGTYSHRSSIRRLLWILYQDVCCLKKLALLEDLS